MPLSHDVRAAVRRLKQNPGFSFVAILTLALGIGANASIFSVINAILFRPLPVERGSELVSLNETLGGNTFPSLSFPNYRDFRDRNSVLTGVTAYRFLPASVGQRGNTQRMWGYLVTGNYFDLLGVTPRMGRLLHPEDDQTRGGHPVVVLSYAGWQKRFGGDPNIVGAKVLVNGREFTVLGVAPEGFFGTELYFVPDVFFSMAMQKELEGGSGYLDKRSTSNTFVLGRLKPGVTMPQAESALNGIARQLGQEYPEDNAGMKIVLTPPGLAGAMVRDGAIGFAAALFGVSCLVLLVACANLASMLLARAGDKRKETAVRLALGAGRGMLIRQLLVENILVALLGGGGGALLAGWIMSALSAWHPPVDIPLVISAPVDIRVFLFALAVSTVTALVFGLMPALQATKTDLVPALKNEAATPRFRYWHLRDYMVAAQVCLSVLLLFCSVLVVKSLQRSLEAPIGYNPKGAVSVSFDLNTQGYDEPRGREFERRVLEKVRAIPGIESAALVDWLPLSLNNSNDAIYVEGKPIPRAADAPLAYDFTISPDYFRTMQTHLVAGREFDARDKQDGKRVAIVNTVFVEQLMDGGNPLGRHFSTGPKGKPIEIVGVVETGKYFSLNEPKKTAFFGPLELWYSSNAALVARPRGISTDSALRSIQQVVREIDPSVSLFSTGTLEDRLSVALFPARIAAMTLSAFGILAVVLAGTGIYGVMAYSVSRRTREIGIRMAIGATQAQVLTTVARRAATVIGTGLIVGLAVALAAGRLLERILYGVTPSDPVTFAVVFAMMLGIGALATFLPARRASRIDPIQALRQE